MDNAGYEQLIRQINSRYFASGKRETIRKSGGAFTAQQIYRLVGQFGGGDDRTSVLSDLDTAKRILPMTAEDATPIIKMGIYTGQKRNNLKILLTYIVDRQEPASRESLGNIFSFGDRTWALRVIDQAGPYHGPPPPATYNTQYTAGNTIAVINQSQYQDPISYVANAAGTALFGNIVSANVPSSRPNVITTVTHYPAPQPYAQPINYPSVSTYPPQNYQPVANLPPYPAPASNAAPPTQGIPSDPPPAYTPVYPSLSQDSPTYSPQQPNQSIYNHTHNYGSSSTSGPPQQPNPEKPPVY